MKTAGEKMNSTLKTLASSITDAMQALHGFIKDPSMLAAKMRVWAQQRQDSSDATRLNRQARSAFAEAFNRSARKKLTVEINDTLRRYKRRNTSLLSFPPRAYEAFSTFSLPVKIAAIVAVSKIARLALWPVMGAWSVAAPLCLLVGARMMKTHKDAANKRDEDFLSGAGLITPCSFSVKDGAAFISDIPVRDGLPIGFPVLMTDTPEWVVRRYKSATRSLEENTIMHAAQFEALRLQSVSPDDQRTIDSSFTDRTDKDCVYILSLLFKDAPVTEHIATVRAFAAESKESIVFNTAAQPPLSHDVVRALAPFCMTGNTGVGLSALAGKMGKSDLTYLAALQSMGHAPDKKQAQDIFRMAADPRFKETLCFRQIAEAALLPEPQKKMLDEFWKDREYRARFTFDQLSDMVVHAEGWGGVALRLARHDYSHALTFEQIRELSQPENAHWAQTYHALRISGASMPHDALKKDIEENGCYATGKNKTAVLKKTA
jgi:hypothetical protein